MDNQNIPQQKEPLLVDDDRSALTQKVTVGFWRQAGHFFKNFYTELGIILSIIPWMFTKHDKPQ